MYADAQFPGLTVSQAFSATYWTVNHSLDHQSKPDSLLGAIFCNHFGVFDPVDPPPKVADLPLSSSATLAACCAASSCCGVGSNEGGAGKSSAVASSSCVSGADVLWSVRSSVSLEWGRCRAISTIQLLLCKPYLQHR